MIRGGGQERGLRGGTESVAQIAALGVTSHIAGEGMERYTNLSKMRDRMETRLKEVAEGLRVFGLGADRLPNTSKLMMPGVSSETQVIALDLAGVEVSAGSACSAGRIEPPYVLTAMGVGDKEALCALRISLGWNTTDGDIDLLISEWIKIFERAASLPNARAH
jgi:cysteine desulfurase